MKKIFLALSLLLISANVSAQEKVTYMDEVKALGAVAGQGLACGSPKYETFEMLARTILVTKAPSDKVQADAMYTYNEAKANAYFSKQIDGFYECADISRRFDEQDIFNMTLYADGTIQMPNGQIFSPRVPYDASLVYKKDDKQRDTAQKIYSSGGNEKVDVTIKGAETPAENAAVISSPPLESSVRRISR